jgi:hypothetical protein
LSGGWVGQFIASPGGRLLAGRSSGKMLAALAVSAWSGYGHPGSMLPASTVRARADAAGTNAPDP